MSTSRSEKKSRQKPRRTVSTVATVINPIKRRTVRAEHVDPNLKRLEKRNGLHYAGSQFSRRRVSPLLVGEWPGGESYSSVRLETGERNHDRMLPNGRPAERVRIRVTEQRGDKMGHSEMLKPAAGRLGDGVFVDCSVLAARGPRAPFSGSSRTFRTR